MKLLSGLVPTAICLLSLVGCASVAKTASGPGRATAASTGCSTTGHYRIGPGDVLGISVWQNKNLDTVATVRPDGMISFPLVNDVRAAGETTMQLQKKLTTDLQQYLAHPRVSVVIQSTQGNTASVLGEVSKPGHYKMSNGKTTVLDMLAEAGGLTPFANKGEISVLRKKSNSTRRIHFRYYKAISNQPGAADFCIQPDDIVVVR